MKIKEKQILIIAMLIIGILLCPMTSRATDPTPEEYLQTSSYLGGGSFISGLVDRYNYLTDIEIPTIRSINNVIGFNNYTNLRTVKVLEGHTLVEGFGNCINLESIEFPSTLKTIAANSFSGCISLKEVVIPKGVTNIGRGAFANCDLNNLMLILEKDSAAEQFAKDSGFEKNVNYKYITYSINDVEINGIPAKAYTGESIRPSIVVKNIDKTGLLQENTNYTVEYGENIRPGKGTIKVTGIENYTGTRTIEFDIVGKDFTRASVDDINDCYYNGSLITPDVKVTYKNKILTKGKDYNVTYINNLKVGTATVIINGIDGYKGTITRIFDILPQGTKVSKLSKDKKKTKVTWKKQKIETTGYQIQYSTNSKFKAGNKTVNIKKNKITSTIIKKLKSKKKYYVRIRTYKTVNGKKYYSDWSKAKSVKVK